MFKVINWEEKTQWNNIIDSFPKRDIYFSHEYFASSLLLDEGEPNLFFFESEEGRVAYPTLKRTIEYMGENALYDIITPYGYGGILVDNLLDEKNVLLQFRKSINEYCIDNNIISEFIRFHPILCNQRNLEDMDILHIRDTIEMKLQQGMDLLDEIPGKNRNMIRKARKNGIEIREIDKDENMNDFLSIYYSTMKRNDATSYYYFKNEYFKESFKLIDSNLHLFGAYIEGEMISASLIFTYGDFMHYHLSGTLKDYLSLGANNLLLFEVAEWGRERGIKSFHLGGGHSGNEDSLYKFKKSFSKLEPLKFYIGKKIHNPKLYKKLVGEKNITEDNGFFPLYRS
ncbi:MAG TPA: GNAT family N-acetyltransferase [Sporosarcina psychrophila]|uniref:Lipid II:glycine glycyltransferase n=1 Tax=Sporosarcina psychrophila TaxID=1476 RepID=A0A921G2S5_SPOPS|nr:GNAT family N-acetyltransferase [Sporosarcina psychrophila]